MLAAAALRLLLLGSATSHWPTNDSSTNDSAVRLSGRRVSWYAKAGKGLGNRASRGQCNNSEWLAANRRAVTALQPNYGCYFIQDDGAFTLDIPPPHPRMLDASGRSLCGPPYFSPLMAGAPEIEVIPGGSISAAALRSRAWERQHAIEAAVNATVAHRWAGLEIDDEFCCDNDGLTGPEIESWIDFVGNLSVALSTVGKRLHVDVNSYLATPAKNIVLPLSACLSVCLSVSLSPCLALCVSLCVYVLHIYITYGPEQVPVDGSVRPTPHCEHRRRWKGGQGRATAVVS
eukprot:COSAG03_NODE_5754_length_1182_cov_1.416436_1_plen_289_part_00